MEDFLHTYYYLLLDNDLAEYKETHNFSSLVLIARPEPSASSVKIHFHISDFDTLYLCIIVICKQGSFIFVQHM